MSDVSGASSGIGRSLALRLAECGAFVILSARSQDGLQHVSSECKMIRMVTLNQQDDKQTEQRKTSIITSASSAASTTENCHTENTEKDLGKNKTEKMDQGDGEFVLAMDLTDLKSLPLIVGKAFGWKNRIDFLFNNAGEWPRCLGGSL